MIGFSRKGLQAQYQTGFSRLFIPPAFSRWLLNFTFSENTHEAQEQTATEFEDLVESPFLVCPDAPKDQVANRLTVSLPNTTPVGKKMTEFFIQLQRKIESRAEEALAESEVWSLCLSPSQLRSPSAKCKTVQNQVDPIRFTTADQTQNTEVKKSLSYAIKEARAELAISRRRVNLANVGQSNADLDPMGYKDVPWAPLSKAEMKNAGEHLGKYIDRFKVAYSISEESYRKLLKPYQSPNVGYVQANPMAPMKEDIDHQIMQTNLMRYMEGMRQGHLDRYRSIVARYPILNFLSSSSPSPAEIQRAASLLAENGKQELQKIKEQGELLRNNGTGYIPSKSLDLLDYSSLVEELLFENQELCEVAIRSTRIRGNRELHRMVYTGAPLLAATFLAPPAVAMSLITGSVVTEVLDSNAEFHSIRQRSNLTPTMKSSLGFDQRDVDPAYRQRNIDLVLAPVTVIMAGAVNARARNIIKQKKEN